MGRLLDLYEVLEIVREDRLRFEQSVADLKRKRGAAVLVDPEKILGPHLGSLGWREGPFSTGESLTERAIH